jgi:hypothetical protein
VSGGSLRNTCNSEFADETGNVFGEGGRHGATIAGATGVRFNDLAGLPLDTEVQFEFPAGGEPVGARACN